MRPLFDPFAASHRRYPANTAIHKAQTAKQRQNRSTSPFAPGATDTKTVTRRFHTAKTHSGLWQERKAAPKDQQMSAVALDCLKGNLGLDLGREWYGRSHGGSFLLSSHPPQPSVSDLGSISPAGKKRKMAEH
jgi:hypothetical protein